ncbi:ABC transporter substrate-binding protein [Muricomes intestini]|uniref:ABC transporter substrate-binding protein n=1 Tax=Muricomes intestini TaxID=1796634 RepID=UPI002FE1B9B2
MKKQIVVVLLSFCVSLLFSGCNIGNSAVSETQGDSDKNKDNITLMHVNADKAGVQEYIENAEKKLNMKINLISPPANAYNRQAEISTLLSSGDPSVDVITINDEMISEFKHKGYLEAIDDTVMTQEIIDCYPSEYMNKMVMKDSRVYSVPYTLDIMALWANADVIKKAGIDRISDRKDFEKLLNASFENGVYGYGGSWEATYAYNEILQFINMFGGDYQNWSNTSTREAMRFLHDIYKNHRIAEGVLFDQYEQMEQKFMNGDYGTIFMYSGITNTFLKAGMYGEDKIHVVPLPRFEEKATNVGSWQYVLNKGSKNKDAAKKFLAYAAGREGSIDYSNAMKQLPARLDIIEDGGLDIPDIDIWKDYVKDVKLKARPLSDDPMMKIEKIGLLFQKYVTDEITLDEFCDRAGEIVE